MKTIRIDKSNVQRFAEEMYNFVVSCSYNGMCFSVNDIMRELKATEITDRIMEQLDKAGFDMQSIEAFSKHNWKIDDLISPIIENPVLVFEDAMYENYFDNRGITEYYIQNRRKK